jgi:hypothetical protein
VWLRLDYYSTDGILSRNGETFSPYEQLYNSSCYVIVAPSRKDLEEFFPVLSCPLSEGQGRPS